MKKGSILPLLLILMVLICYAVIVNANTILLVLNPEKGLNLFGEKLESMGTFDIRGKLKIPVSEKNEFEINGITINFDFHYDATTRDFIILLSPVLGSGMETVIRKEGTRLTVSSPMFPDQNMEIDLSGSDKNVVSKNLSIKNIFQHLLDDGDFTACRVSSKVLKQDSKSKDRRQWVYSIAIQTSANVLKDVLQSINIHSDNESNPFPLPEFSLDHEEMLEVLGNLNLLVQVITNNQMEPEMIQIDLLDVKEKNIIFTLSGEINRK